MESNRAAVSLLAIMTLLGGVGLAPSVGQPHAGAEQIQPRPTPGVCDYAELYNETIDAVVLVDQPLGQGSGFVYQVFENGTSYIVTNQHVVATADRVEVTFRDGTIRTGTVIGTAVSADLAVVRVTDTPGYVTNLSVADSEPLPGQEVAALGSPFGLRGTITHGIISSTDRGVPTDRGFALPDVIQTDAPINPGNSGGPLVTCDGTVVGVNTAGVPAGRAENIGFAVSATLINRVVPELIATGEFHFAYLGVRTTALTLAISEANDLNTTKGVMVVETIEGGPADGTLRGAGGTAMIDGQEVPTGGDVIVAIEDHPIRSASDLSGYLATETSPGDEVTLTIIRDGERQTVSIVLSERPSPPQS